MTRARTGVLVYVSVLEGQVRILADRAVEGCLPTADRQRREAELVAALGDPQGFAERVGRSLASLADLLEPLLPRPDDDIDELPNEVRDD